MRTIKSLGGEAEASERFGMELQEYYRLSIRKAIVYVFYASTTFTFLPYCTSCLVLYYGGKLVQTGGIENGELISFVFYMQSLFSVFGSMGSMYSSVMSSLGASEKVFT